MAATGTAVGGLLVNAVNLAGDQMQGDLSFASGKRLIPDGSTASASSGAATLSRQMGVITSETLSTAKGATYTLTLTNSLISATSIVMASVQLGTSTQGTPMVVSVTPGTSQVVIVVLNNDGTNAFNGTIKISYIVWG